MLSSARLRRNLFALLVVCILTVTLVILRPRFYHDSPFSKQSLDLEPAEKPALPKPIYKPSPHVPPLIVDNFPLAASAKLPTELPPIPIWNLPPDPHVEETTPVFIGFTRNWRLLQQTVVSYITAGWPPGDIYVVENTGTMHSNRDNLLTLQNPFYLDYQRLTTTFGINVISTPTLLTFAQLQNFYTYTAIEKGWEHYFWGHMDVVAVSDEEYAEGTYASLYSRAVDALRKTTRPDYGSLATLWFAYDKLALVRTKAFLEVGGWDTTIPFYMTDCDMHERLFMREYKIEEVPVGKIWDVSTSLDDLAILYRRGMKSSKAKRDEAGGTAEAETSDPAKAEAVAVVEAKAGAPAEAKGASAAERNSPLYQDLLRTLDEMQNYKNGNSDGRNTWQARQRGGQGEPFYRDPEGFEQAIQMTMELGRRVFEQKWGRARCDLRDSGMVEGDAWKVVADWENPDVQKKAQKELRKAERLKEKEAAAHG